MKAFVGMVALAALAGLAQGAVSIKDNKVTVTPDAGSRTVKVAYELVGDDGVVTFDVLKGGVSIGGQFLKNTSGDIGQVLSAGPHEFVWYADTEWCENVALGAVTVKVEAWALDNPPDYMVCDLVTGRTRYYTQPDALPGEGGVTNDIYRTYKLVMRKVPAKGVQWRMGLVEGEGTGPSGTETQHYVTMTNDYYIGVFEFTVGHLRRVTDTFGTAETTANAVLPTRSLTWTNVRGSTNGSTRPTDDSYIGKLRTRVKGIEFDLPTDEQWEYACRAGSGGYFSNGATDDREMGWYKENSKLPGEADYHPHPVGTKKANSWGIYDMHGNVWELTRDGWYDPTTDSVTESLHAPSSGNKVMRGGCYRHEAKWYSHSAHRLNRGTGAQEDQGFRVACPAIAK